MRHMPASVWHPGVKLGMAGLNWLIGLRILGWHVPVTKPSPSTLVLWSTKTHDNSTQTTNSFQCLHQPEKSPYSVSLIFVSFNLLYCCSLIVDLTDESLSQPSFHLSSSPRNESHHIPFQELCIVAWAGMKVSGGWLQRGEEVSHLGLFLFL